jgi:hypothetical protein
VEDLADLDHAGNLLALLGRQHAGQGSLDLIDCVVNHVVVTDIDTEVSASLRAPRRHEC